MICRRQRASQLPLPRWVRLFAVVRELACKTYFWKESGRPWRQTIWAPRQLILRRYVLIAFDTKTNVGLTQHSFNRASFRTFTFFALVAVCWSRAARKPRQRDRRGSLENSQPRSFHRPNKLSTACVYLSRREEQIKTSYSKLPQKNCGAEYGNRKSCSNCLKGLDRARFAPSA